MTHVEHPLVVYVAHPLGAGPDRQENRARAARWCAWLLIHGFAPVATWIVLTGELDETPENRARGLAADCATVVRCDCVMLVGGRVSEGMYAEALAAWRAGIDVYDLTKKFGQEPPAIDLPPGWADCLPVWTP